jgi:hypothetical protein
MTYDPYATPLRRFKASNELVAAHADMIAMPVFQRSIEVALLEYADTQAKRTDEEAHACAYRQQGAQQFVQQLIGLSRLESRTPVRDPHNLAPE